MNFPSSLVIETSFIIDCYFIWKATTECLELILLLDHVMLRDAWKSGASSFALLSEAV